MNQDWKSFLIEQGASEQQGLLKFSESESKYFDLSLAPLLINPSDRALIKVSGEDAESFLQNQLSNDIRNVTETMHQSSAWCSPKGRIIANFRIFKQGDAFFLVLAADLLEVVMKKLRMYVMMSKVTIEDVSMVTVHFSVAGKDAAVHIQEFIGSQSLPENSTIQYDGLSILHVSDAQQRFDIFGELDAAKELWLQCKTVATPVSGLAAKYLNIISGSPEISAESSEAWIPQMVNYIQLNGVDFKKGCYPGQEVVARLNYLGKTKRRMYHLEIDTDELPKIGDSIKSEKDNEAGKILNAVINSNNKVNALAILKIADANNQLNMAANNANISLLDLPYNVDDQ